MTWKLLGVSYTELMQMTPAEIEALFSALDDYTPDLGTEVV